MTRPDYDRLDEDLLDDDEIASLADEASYVCPSCGEEIVVPVDAAAGTRQSYTEDCPVCCCPNRLTVELDADGGVDVAAEPD